MRSMEQESGTEFPELALLVGLTGGIACGKSHANRVFGELGAYVIDADALAHELIHREFEAYHEILAAFGPEVLDSSGEIDRKKLGVIVFSDPQARKRLNAILHPRIIEEENRRSTELQSQFGSCIIIVDAALMIEGGYHSRFDKLVVVHCKPELQLHRLMTRDGLAFEDAQARIESQMPIAEKLKLADYILETSGTYRQTRAQIINIHGLLVRDLRTKNTPTA